MPEWQILVWGLSLYLWFSALIAFIAVTVKDKPSNSY
jgi:hypothetical protein